MNLFQRVLGLKTRQRFSAKQLADARTLVHTAHGVTVSSFIPLLDLFSDLQLVVDKNQTAKWDFILTTTGVGVAFTRMANLAKKDEVESYSLAIHQALNEWDIKAYDAVADFCLYLKKLADNDLEINSSDDLMRCIGVWITVKLKQEDKEFGQLTNNPSLLLAMGNICCSYSLEYWNDIIE